MPPAIGTVAGLSAQSPRKPVQTTRLPDDGLNKAPETEVTLELIAGATAATEHAQAWGQRLQKLDVRFQMRQAVSGDKPEVKEQKQGRMRRVTVVAVLDRNGKILCHDRNFTLAEAEKLGPYPLFVKPSSLGSSIGVRRCEDARQLREGIETANLTFDGRLSFSSPCPCPQWLC